MRYFESPNNFRDNYTFARNANIPTTILSALTLTSICVYAPYKIISFHSGKIPQKENFQVRKGSTEIFSSRWREWLRRRWAIRDHFVIVRAWSYLDLSFGELKIGSDFYATWSAQILVEVKLFLELQQLRVRVCGSKSSRAWSLLLFCERNAQSAHRCTITIVPLLHFFCFLPSSQNFFSFCRKSAP